MIYIKLRYFSEALMTCQKYYTRKTTPWERFYFWTERELNNFKITKNNIKYIQCLFLYVKYPDILYIGYMSTENIYFKLVVSKNGNNGCFFLSKRPDFFMSEFIEPFFDDDIINDIGNDLPLSSSILSSGDTISTTFVPIDKNYARDVLERLAIRELFPQKTVYPNIILPITLLRSIKSCWGGKEEIKDFDFPEVYMDEETPWPCKRWILDYHSRPQIEMENKNEIFIYTRVYLLVVDDDAKSYCCCCSKKKKKLNFFIKHNNNTTHKEENKAVRITLLNKYSFTIQTPRFIGRLRIEKDKELTITLPPKIGESYEMDDFLIITSHQKHATLKLRYKVKIYTTFDKTRFHKWLVLTR